MANLNGSLQRIVWEDGHLLVLRQVLRAARIIFALGSRSLTSVDPTRLTARFQSCSSLARHHHRWQLHQLEVYLDQERQGREKGNLFAQVNMTQTTQPTSFILSLHDPALP
jgi:hypothetical protein